MYNLEIMFLIETDRKEIIAECLSACLRCETTESIHWKIIEILQHRLLSITVKRAIMELAVIVKQINQQSQ